MGFFWRVTDEITPASGNIDLSSLLGTAEIPQFIGLTYWVSTPGNALAGGWGMDLQWTDIEGNVQTEFGTPFSLQASGSLTRIPLQIVTRQSDSSAFDIVGTLSGSDGGAKIRYALLASPSSCEGNYNI